MYDIHTRYEYKHVNIHLCLYHISACTCYVCVHVYVWYVYMPCVYSAYLRIVCLYQYHVTLITCDQWGTVGTVLDIVRA